MIEDLGKIDEVNLGYSIHSQFEGDAYIMISGVIGAGELLK